MTGSDQVWNPVASSSIEPYFLTFAPTEKKKISYASSFGVNFIDERIKKKMGEWLSDYTSIAVRENSGISLIKLLSGKEASWVIDPTLLLTKKEWQAVSVDYPHMPQRYVIVYDLAESIAIDKLALKIGQERNIPVYRICKRAYGMKKKVGIVNILDAGPAEFLSLIAHAEYVVTNSFHGTAFSINFETPFFTVLSNQKKNNSRMESLLGLVNLKNRIILENKLIESIDTASPIDFETVHNLLKIKKIESEAYLKSSLC